MSHFISTWCQKQRELLQLERQEEIDQLTTKLETLPARECEKAGLSVLSLVIDDISISLYGRTCISVRRKDKKLLPNHGMKVGDEAMLREKGNGKDTKTVKGVISKVTAETIDLVSDTYDDEELEPPLRLDQLASEATFKKLQHAINDVETLIDGPAWPIADTIFNGRAIEEPQYVKLERSFNSNLNFSQLEAIEVALGAKHMALIHGPPGTGKTTAVVELVKQAVLRKQKVLVTAPSNVAVDNILERLVDGSSTSSAAQKLPRVVRLGHPARLSEITKLHSLEHLISIDENTRLVADVREDILIARRNADRAKNRSERHMMYGEMKALRKELRRREENVVKDIIKNSDVILCTCVGASSRLLRNVEFDMTVIDEAAQALHISCWIPMLLAKKVCLAGDHNQLPPTVKSPIAESQGLSNTLFEEMMIVKETGLPSPVARMLKVQYRMNDLICSWCSKEMYNGQLISDSAVAVHDLSTLKNINHSTIGELGNIVMMLVDTAGCSMMEDFCEGGSHRNPHEAILVKKHVDNLVTLGGLNPSQIGVITPYNGQLEILKELMGEEYPCLEIRTVDGFQGGEKEAIILSMVRSNDHREVGFLADRRRINVAVTRAKRHVAIICDSETCSSDAFLGRLIEYVSENGEHQSASQYEDIINSGASSTNSNVISSSLSSSSSQSPSLSTSSSVHTDDKKDSSQKPCDKVQGSSQLEINSENQPVTPSKTIDKDNKDKNKNEVKTPTGRMKLDTGYAKRIMEHSLGIRIQPRTPGATTGGGSRPVHDAFSNSKNDSKRTSTVAIEHRELIKANIEMLFELLIKDFVKSSNHLMTSPSKVICGNVDITELEKKSKENDQDIHSYRRQSPDNLVEIRVTRVNDERIEPVLMFPSTLSSYQRMKIHELAEKYGCSHVSSGEGIKRTIEVGLLHHDTYPLQVVSESFSSLGVKSDASDDEGDNKSDVRNDKVNDDNGGDGDAIMEKMTSEIQELEIEESGTQARIEDNADGCSSTQKKIDTGRKNKKEKKKEEEGDVDDEYLLNAAIKANQVYQNDRKYRIDTKPIQNNDRTILQSSLRQNLADQQWKRTTGNRNKGSDRKSSSDSASASTSLPKNSQANSLWDRKKGRKEEKYAKPPKTVFGGGRIGTVGTNGNDYRGFNREEIAAKRLASFGGGVKCSDVSARTNSSSSCEVAQLKLKWNKVEFDLTINPQEEQVASLKNKIKDITGVPNDRQKLLAKGLWPGVLKDNADLSNMPFTSDQVWPLTMMGSADVL